MCGGNLSTYFPGLRLAKTLVLSARRGPQERRFHAVSVHWAQRDRTAQQPNCLPSTILEISAPTCVKNALGVNILYINTLSLKILQWSLRLGFCPSGPSRRLLWSPLVSPIPTLHLRGGRGAGSPWLCSQPAPTAPHPEAGFPAQNLA